MVARRDASALRPGVLDAPPQVADTRRGPGDGRSAGTGADDGIGPGNGRGLGPGRDRNAGGDVYQVGGGVTAPRVLRQVRPSYTAPAMSARLSGTAVVECIVNPDGTVGEVRIVRSVDPTFGLDQEAVKAVRQWRFLPGTRHGEPVAVLVRVELAFAIH